MLLSYGSKNMEYMILKGSFYSDFNIFDVYDICIEELAQKIMEEEIDYIIKSVEEVVTYLRRISPVWRDLQNGKRNFIL